MNAMEGQLLLTVNLSQDSMGPGGEISVGLEGLMRTGLRDIFYTAWRW